MSPDPGEPDPHRWTPAIIAVAAVIGVVALLFGLYLLATAQGLLIAYLLFDLRRHRS